MNKKNMNELIGLIRQVKAASSESKVVIFADNGSILDLLYSGFPLDNIERYIVEYDQPRIVIVPAESKSAMYKVYFGGEYE